MLEQIQLELPGEWLRLAAPFSHYVPLVKQEPSLLEQCRECIGARWHQPGGEGTLQQHLSEHP